eukprot:TRINITY_DN6925_c0_g1_i2.p1 TRINITY_DN6925_c0_g1~~TRINITY_DN6925_c0_g1_i2.p1  ORF type:complete len:951 (+),score=208.22 TRINITY_DN6925_c0_g1_i2:205-3057(+)
MSMDRMLSTVIPGSTSYEDGWYHPQCSPPQTSSQEQQWCLQKHNRCPSIDSDLILQRIAASSPGKSFGTQIELHQQEQIQYSYIQVETSSPLANITSEALPMLEALCRQPELLKRLAEGGGLAEVNSFSCGKVCGSGGAQTQMAIPSGISSPMLSPSLPSYTVDSSFVSPGMTVGFKAPVFEINNIQMSETGSCSRTDSPSISCDMDATYIDSPQVEREYMGQGGFMDPRSRETSQKEVSTLLDDKFNCAVQKNGKVRRVKSNGPLENQTRRGLPRNIVKRLSWWLCQHANNPYPTKNEKADLANALGIDKNQVCNWFVNARTRFWKPIVVKIFQQQYVRLLKLAEEEGDEAKMLALKDVLQSESNINAPNLISLFDKQAIENLEEAILDAFQTGFSLLKMLVLFETPAGYALFKVLKEDCLSNVQDLWQQFDTLEAAKKIVTLKAWKQFDNTAEALQGASAIVDQTLDKDLKKFLKKNASGDRLAVLDSKLGSSIKEKLGINVESNNAILELSRGIRNQLGGFLGGTSMHDLKPMQLGLSHTLSRYKLKFSPEKVDTMIVQAIGLLDELDKELNTYAMRVREWYGWHFPEMAKVINDNIMYAKIIKLMGMRVNAPSIDFSQISLDEDEEHRLKDAAFVSMGTEISEDDLLRIQELCDQVIMLSEYRAQLYEYIRNRMNALAPNLTVLVGELVGARLIAHAGSLINLAKQPASTVQILGAEKALFRALKTKHETPKYGLIYHASLVGQSNPKNKGKISRVLASKCSLAVRYDALGESIDSQVGIEGRSKVEARLRQLEGKEIIREGPRANVQEAIPKYDKEMQGGPMIQEVVTYNQDADVVMPSTDKKKKKKRKVEEMQPNGDQGVKEEQQAEPQSEGKKDKKKKKKIKAEDGIENGAAASEQQETEDKKEKKKSKKKEEIQEEDVPMADVEEPQQPPKKKKKKSKKEQE